MTHEQIFARVSTIVAETVGGEPIDLTPAMTAADVPGWDSLAHVQIIVAIEKAFGVRFRTGEISAIADVGQLVSRIGAKLDAQT